MSDKLNIGNFLFGTLIGLFVLPILVKPVSAKFSFSLPKLPDFQRPTIIIPRHTIIRPLKPQKPCFPRKNCNSTPTPTPTLTPTVIPLPTGLVSWWPAEGNTDDTVGTNNGTLMNGATFASGKIGQAFSLDGVDDFVQAGTVGFPMGNSNRTIELWVKINSFLADIPDPHSPLESFFLGYGNFGASGQAYALGTAGNVLYFTVWGGAIFGSSLQTGTWYHVAVTNEGNFATLYLNGIPVSSGTLSINTTTNTQFYIGRIPGSLGDIRKLNGLIDEIVVYNRALTPAEILNRATI